MTAAMAGAWDFGWEALVAIFTALAAIGTLVLAGMTWGLARATRKLAGDTKRLAEETTKLADETKQEVTIATSQVEASQRQVEASQEQAEAAQAALRAQVRPVLIDLPRGRREPLDHIVYPNRGEFGDIPKGAVHVWAAPDEVLISLPIRNAGTGLAMIRGAHVQTALPATEPVPVVIDPANIPPGEHGRVNFRAEPGAAFDALAQAFRGGNFSVVVAYADLAGQQLTSSRFDISLRDGGDDYPWQVRQVHFEEPGSGSPYAGSGPAF